MCDFRILIKIHDKLSADYQPQRFCERALKRDLSRKNRNFYMKLFSGLFWLFYFSNVIFQYLIVNFVIASFKISVPNKAKSDHTVCISAIFAQTALPPALKAEMLTNSSYPYS